MTARKLTRAYVQEYVWRHNSYFGTVRRAAIAMRAIYQSPTTNAEAKALAIQIQTKLDMLKVALKERID